MGRWLEVVDHFYPFWLQSTRFRQIGLEFQFNLMSESMMGRISGCKLMWDHLWRTSGKNVWRSFMNDSYTVFIHWKVFKEKVKKLNWKVLSKTRAWIKPSYFLSHLIELNQTNPVWGFCVLWPLITYKISWNPQSSRKIKNRKPQIQFP